MIDRFCGEAFSQTFALTAGILWENGRLTGCFLLCKRIFANGMYEETAFFIAETIVGVLLRM
ncbi:hypothetical protein TFKS16_2213 [Tannerella forsythia KS16]|uniref:Uncharacterized protein n=1 Tax=Tannerella forsythia (strain ATCC 43037 / JCM 10827 / CCUG 21028 A / KCTC 5666 / FDC 338) TaxID=203275 RepID=G8UL74_TANFA|nr:hypothetical protein BFO_2550 [Tannerella forsythia 92A2]KKY60645.1 hypothetical protein Tanf_11565 [Tannerella forsythia]BAR49678.1 hypothetical protein TF3313_2222 [Tannerella forsythia 3313]BAR52415.1 hypothetical protein TFKS16_2213 [Tannerella forsythia KS16]